ncbi:MAG: RluA family pseudouridine synthase [Nitrospirae bacterium]|nr:RluA family pseudouridine synthase [Nitrospirota bacterium]
MIIKSEKIRLDKFLVIEKLEFSRSKIQKMIKNGDVLVNGKTAKVSRFLNKGDKVEIIVGKQEKREIQKEDIEIEILFEGKDYLVIDKPAGIVVHPSETGHSKGTVVNALLDKVDKGVGEEFRPGIVHRLDKDTSGALIVAKTKEGYKYFVEQFKKRKVKKEYLALVKGILIHKEGIIDSPISRDVKSRKKMGLASEKEGKRAVSKYKVKEEFDDLSLVEVEIETGRTHQIRVHMAAIDHPVVGDNTYGVGSYNRRFKEKYGLRRQFLHAERLEFKDLEGKKKKIVVDLPEDLKNVLSKL